jgi:3-hydroxyacyl-CoA dehydrogenase
MSSEIRTVGVVSTGVIGSSWIALFLSRGLRVLICSTSADAEEKLSQYLQKVWPIFAGSLAPTAPSSNYKFVGETFDGYYDQLDFVQEVTELFGARLLEFASHRLILFHIECP